MLKSQISNNNMAKRIDSPLQNFGSLRRFSPTSSVSSGLSGGQSLDLISQNASSSTTNDFPKEAITNKTSLLSSTIASAAIKLPLSNPSNKKLKKSALVVFKLIQKYMNDKKTKLTTDKVAISLLEKGQTNFELRDEIFVQLIYQLTDSSRPDSIKKGWELLGIFAYFFLPHSPDIYDKVLKFVEANTDSLLGCFILHR